MPLVWPAMQSWSFGESAPDPSARASAWLAAQKDRHPPKSPIGVAIRYAQNHWEELGVFLDDDRVPLDNNGSERPGAWLAARDET